MKRLLNFGNILFFTMSVLWLYFAFRYAFEYVSIDLMQMTPKTALVFIFLTILVFVLYSFKSVVIPCLKKIYSIFIFHKLWVLVGLTAVQLFILFTSGGLARADTTILYQITTDPNYAQETMYISNNPNNFLFLIYLKVVYRISPENLIFNLSLLNIFFINASLVVTYRLVKDYFKEKVAEIYFMLYLFLFALQPQYIYTYTDAITLFFIVIMCWVLSLIIKNWGSKMQFIIGSLLLGLLISVCYNLRPPTIIYIIALLIVLIATKRSQRFAIKKIATVALLAFSMFSLSNMALNTLLEKQNFVYYDNNYSRSLLYYVDLGLTTSGNNHGEIPQEIFGASEDKLDDLVLKDIKKRLNDFTIVTFISHLFNKYYWITGEGMFGWNLEKVMMEETVLQMPWIQGITNTEFARQIRSVVYARSEDFKIQGIFFQIIWIITVMGIIVYSFFFKPSNFNIGLWFQIALFGGFLFLMIFEGGRTRYLIQFLPPILLLSSIGWEQVMTHINRLKNLNLKNNIE